MPDVCDSDLELLRASSELPHRSFSGIVCTSVIHSSGTCIYVYSLPEMLVCTFKAFPMWPGGKHARCMQ